MTENRGDTHTLIHACSTHELQEVIHAIETIETKYEMRQGTYVKYQTEAYRQLPHYTLTIRDKRVTFLVDSGATNSVIRAHDFSPPPKMSGRFVYSVGASGTTIRENFTIPRLCKDSDNVTIKHSFLLSEHCPINLLGRDLMITLGISILSTAEGLKIVKTETIMNQMVKTYRSPLLYVYQWHLANSKVSRSLLEEVENIMSPHTIFMSSSDLHSVSHVSKGVDTNYEIEWYQDEAVDFERLHVSDIYWDAHKCAAAVTLTDGQVTLFDVPNSVPHIALARTDKCEWEEMGPFVKNCTQATDWTETCIEDIQYCARLQSYKKHFSADVHSMRSVTLISDDQEELTHSFICMSIEEAQTHPLLSQIPITLWAKGKNDVGLVKNAEPVIITPKSDYRPCQKQYPLRQEAIDGITPVFEALRAAGVIVPCQIPVCTPILPVKKIRDAGQPEEWRFVQDLQAVNRAVQPRAPIVPNPYTILSQIPPVAKWFTVVDLANAFFSVPIHPDSQYWFAFTFKDKTWTFTRLCQGYCESPTIYNSVLAESLSSLELTAGSALLQYFDDLLLCAPTKEQCETDTVKLLRHLANEGHKVSLSKLKLVQQQVTFLGHLISPEGKQLLPKRIQAIQKIPKPKTKKQIMSFLGLCSYCRAFIPNYSVMEAQLSAIAHGKNLHPHDEVTWTPEAEQAFFELKQALMSPPTLGIPDPTKPFIQTVDEKEGCMSSVLLQDHGGRLRPVAYFSAKLDPVAAGLPRCLRAVAAAEKAVIASRDIVSYSDLTLLVPHSVSMILLEQKTSHLSTARWLRYNAILLEMPNITVKRCTILNPATLLPLSSENEDDEHDCNVVLSQVCTPRLDLKDTPLTNPDLILFVDGSASRDTVTGINNVGFAVVDFHEVVCSGRLPSHFSAQTAELIALTEACKFAEGKSVTIYTDSRYAFGIVHDFGTLWKH